MKETLMNKQQFCNSINKPSLGFKNPDYEEKYQKKKLRNTNLNILIIVSLFFLFLMHFLIHTENHFESALNLSNSQYRLLINETKNNSYPQENQQQKSPQQKMRGISQNHILMNVNIIGIVLEIIICCCNRFKILRGFAIIIFSLVEEIIISASAQNAFDSNKPLYNPNSIFNILSLLVICFLYSANWICGSLQIVCIIVANDINLFITPWTLDLEFPFQLILSLICGFTLCVTIFNLEYFHRKTFFRRMESEKQRKAIRGILHKLPEPLIIAQKGEMKWSNESFKSLSTLIKNDELPSPIECPSTRTIISIMDGNESQYNLILRNVKDKHAIQTMKEVIEQEKNLKEEEFEITILNKKVKYYEVTSMEFEMSEENSVLYLMKDITNFKKLMT